MLGVSVSTSRNLIGSDKLGLLCIAEETYRSVGGNRQANPDKHLNLIQTISLCLLQEACSDRSKRPWGCINGSGGCLPVSLDHCHSPRLLLCPSLSLSLLVNLAANDLRRTLTRSLRPCSLLVTVSHHLATLALYRCCLSVRIYTVSVLCRKVVRGCWIGCMRWISCIHVWNGVNMRL